MPPSSPLEHSAPGTPFGEACWITFTNLSISELPQQPGCSEGALLLPAQQNSTVHLLEVAPRTGGNSKCLNGFRDHNLIFHIIALFHCSDRIIDVRKVDFLSYRSQKSPAPLSDALHRSSQIVSDLLSATFTLPT